VGYKYSIWGDLGTKIKCHFEHPLQLSVGIRQTLSELLQILAWTDVDDTLFPCFADSVLTLCSH